MHFRVFPQKQGNGFLAVSLFLLSYALVHNLLHHFLRPCSRLCGYAVLRDFQNFNQIAYTLSLFQQSGQHRMQNLFLSIPPSSRMRITGRSAPLFFAVSSLTSNKASGLIFKIVHIPSINVMSGQPSPLSHFDTAWEVTPRREANSSCVIFRFCL